MYTPGIHRQLVVLGLVILLYASPATADFLTFYPTDDTFIRMKDPGNNYGSRTIMQIRNRYGHWSHPDYWELDALVGFDLSSIPAGTDIPSATLYLYYHDYHHGHPSPAGRELTCYRLTSDWDEDTVTWNTRPSHASLPTSNATIPSTPGAWMAWDVTADVNAFVNNPDVDDFGWQIMDERPWNNYNIPTSKFQSKEFGDCAPYLAVVPEPATLGLLSMGTIALLHRRRRR